MKTGSPTVTRTQSPLRRNRTLEADYYAQRQAEAEARRKAPPKRGNALRTSEARRNEIAELIRQGLPRPEIMCRMKAGPNIVEDVRADMHLGKHGGFK